MVRDRVARACFGLLAGTLAPGCGGSGGSGDGLGSGETLPTATGTASGTGGTTSTGTTSTGTPTSGTGPGGDTSTSTGAASTGTTSTAGTTGASTSATDTGSSGSGGSSTGGAPPSDDPFDPLACTGTAWTAADATQYLGGMPREILDSATIQVRTRTCPNGTCGAWGANEDWAIHYLTYSGGVVTHWKDLPANMNLVLFDDGGVTRLSMQHESFAAGGYPDQDGVVYDFPPVAVAYPHLRAYNEFPDDPNDYVDLDYQVADGVLVLGDGCAVFTADPFGTGQPYTQQFGALFRW